MTYVAMNQRCEREIATLGEAWPAIKKAEEAYQALLVALGAVQKCEDQRADARASEFLDLLDNARHDSSWAEMIGDAEDAFREARVQLVLP